MVGKTYLEHQSEIYDPSGKQEIKIVPVLLGAKKGGLGKVILGIGLMVAAPWLAGVAAQGGAALGMSGAMAKGAVGQMVVSGGSAIGVAAQGMAMRYGSALLMGGIAQLLAPTPDTPSDTDMENYSFSGAVNTTQQGVAIPVCYGQLMVGGAVISAGMKAEDY
jgi:predicted phage tail protein